MILEIPMEIGIPGYILIKAFSKVKMPTKKLVPAGGSIGRPTKQ